MGLFAVALTAEDERGLNPLFWSNIAPYGAVKLDLGRRITLTGDTRTTGPGTGPITPGMVHAMRRTLRCPRPRP